MYREVRVSMIIITLLTIVSKCFAFVISQGTHTQVCNGWWNIWKKRPKHYQSQGTLIYDRNTVFKIYCDAIIDEWTTTENNEASEIRHINQKPMKCTAEIENIWYGFISCNFMTLYAARLLRFQYWSVYYRVCVCICFFFVVFKVFSFYAHFSLINRKHKLKTTCRRYEEYCYLYNVENGFFFSFHMHFLATNKTRIRYIYVLFRILINYQQSSYRYELNVYFRSLSFALQSNCIQWNLIWHEKRSHNNSFWTHFLPWEWSNSFDIKLLFSNWTKTKWK